MEINKVFCIGLTATATKSVSVALNTLGFPTKHYPRDPTTLSLLTNGQYELPILEKYRGISDIQAAIYFAQFDETYPGSKFILTTRPRQQWLKAVRRKLKRTSSVRHANADYRDVFRLACYGEIEPSDSRLLWCYDRHHEAVRSHFRKRDTDLLTLDIANGEGWERLCPFLGAAIPDKAFPHKYKRARD